MSETATAIAMAVGALGGQVLRISGWLNGMIYLNYCVSSIIGSKMSEMRWWLQEERRWKEIYGGAKTRDKRTLETT
jgi:hypothetical protein